MVNANTSPPKVLVGTLSVTCIAVIYCAITFVLYLDNILPYLINVGTDGMVLIAVVVVAVTVGKPLSYLNCNKLGNTGGNSYDFTASMGRNLAKTGSRVDYYLWVGGTKTSCFEMKSIWGLSIALCILFLFSAICSVCLWRRSKVTAPKTIDA
ncbi:MAG: hypothetical protein M1825_004052 [Sarcosagium campestre]|nr:MAG: hypothetical protein M1825_004052 [Sarcosagium campestre]